MSEPSQRIALITLGCPKNQVDSEVLAGELRRNGARLVSEPESADCILINTCGFVADAKRESIDAILKAVRLRKKGRKPRVVAWGCLAERYGRDIRREMPEVDAFFGVEPYEAVGRYILGDGYRWSEQAYCGRVLSTPPHTAYLKIADGCDHACTFCAIPLFKGKYRSRTLPGLVREAERLAEGGVRELILVAQDTTAYGTDLNDGSSLVRLLENLVRIRGIEWIRILYGHPDRIDDSLIDAVANEPKICKALDLPLQHAADPVLAVMGRGTSKTRAERLIEKLRVQIPGLVLRTTFIVGFPGETEVLFEELVEFVRRIRFERMGAFVYSPEEGTPAYGLTGAVPRRTAAKRHRTLMELQRILSERVNRALESKILPVIVDGFDPKQGLHFGRTQGDSPDIDQTVWIRGDVRVGTIVPVRIEGSSAYDLAGSAAGHLENDKK